MKVILSLLCAITFLAGPAALAGQACQKCTHDLQVQYRKCKESGKDQETCSKEQLAAAQTCVVICQKNKAPDEK
jgi:hypothetical protein